MVVGVDTVLGQSTESESSALHVAPSRVIQLGATYSSPDLYTTVDSLELYVTQSEKGTLDEPQKYKKTSLPQ